VKHKLVVVAPFADFPLGTEIEDQAAIEAILGTYQESFVVRVKVREPREAQTTETAAKALPRTRKNKE
jgi:hypothetical protein